MIETWEIANATPDEVAMIREWVGKRNATMERLDGQTINVYLDDRALEDELTDMCDAYGIECWLI